jgi:hypothetical protein
MPNDKLDSPFGRLNKFLDQLEAVNIRYDLQEGLGWALGSEQASRGNLAFPPPIARNPIITRGAASLPG